MPAIAATAPGKIILFGEHAVVYGHPALAVPVTQVRAKAVVTANPAGTTGQVIISAADIDLQSDLSNLPHDHPLALVIQNVIEMLGIDHLPALSLKITSTIPIAAGLGSGAAVSVAITRALSTFLGHPLDNEQVSQIAYRIDQKYHGTPSGIDNTVITYSQPIFFIRGQPFIRINPASPFTIVIGNTGISSSTSAVVNDLRQRWQADSPSYEHLFNEIGAIALAARENIVAGRVDILGLLMRRNHALLQELDVSSPELDHLVEVADGNGALGAKLSGGGRGGNMIALVHPENADSLARALRSAGAVNTITTTVGNPAIIGSATLIEGEV
jgi:mevalonate kinase